ncbi:unnamed protein product [Diatraea saccharalis]|uniref:Uncharacterized protein n=1 Tax=Diatraea saccharalis TaxID=40085 RepID=A0A9P0C917_9NEOP|nr:unnamed protein product [Diatraea saccharalis]
MSLFPAYAQENITESIQEAASVSPTLEASLLASDEEELRSCEESSDRENQASLRILPSPPPPPSCDYYQDRVRDTGNLRVSTLYYPGRPNINCRHFISGIDFDRLPSVKFNGTIIPYSKTVRNLGGIIDHHFSWRPQVETVRKNYSSRDELTLGTAGGRRERRRRHSKRYFESAAPPPPPERDEAAARSAAYRRMLADAPTDVDLWLRYIHFLEWSRGGGAALQAAAEAGAALRGGEPRGAGLIRDARLELARRHLPATEYLTVLRDMIADEKSVSARCELWAELVESAGARAGAGAGEGALQVLRAALADVARHAPAYPRLLYAYVKTGDRRPSSGSVIRQVSLSGQIGGIPFVVCSLKLLLPPDRSFSDRVPRFHKINGSVLRAAGLWESLVLLVELVATVNFPPSAAFPPRAGAGAGAGAGAEAERALAAAEEAVARGGLPLGARWARVERARAAAHWRPATDLAPDQLQADPQRAPLAGDVCDAVRGGAAAPLALAVALLMLAKVQ